MDENGQVKARILIVEDESIVALDISHRLKAMGYQVVGISATSAQAIQMVRSGNPDLVLMDIKIKGGVDGIATAEIVREQFHLPVIFLTAFADEATLRRASISEAFGYILKPFEERELSTNIEIALYKHKMEKRLRDSEERFSLAVRGANDGIWDWHIREASIYYSTRFLEMLGLEEGCLGQAIDDWFGLIHPDELALFRLEFSRHLDGQSPQFQFEGRMWHAKAGYRWFLTRGLAVRDEDGVAYRMAGSLSDVTERKVAEQQLLHDALHDHLTSLPNRSLLLERLGRVIERAHRNESLIYAVLFLDLDQFKVVNDSLGHQAGDRLLIEIGQRLEKLLRSSDTLARLGGDEFVVLLEDLASAEAAWAVAERIQEELLRPFEINGQLLVSSASIGIVIGPSESERPEDILRDADIAMYRAKAGGKARYALFDSSLRERAMTRLEMESDLRNALGRQELKVYYQPILSLETGKVAGFEALLRWIHPTRGMILPSEFIPLAEETGLILPIGAWVISEACRQLRRWQKIRPGQPPLYMNVNISSRQFAQPGLVKYIQQVLDETGLDPRTLKLEITEHTIMDISSNAAAVLAQLRDLGVHVLIDDFGTGYSSLGYVHNFPIDTIKIDRIFISQMGVNGCQADIARTIINLAHDLGIGTIAEGIETEEQLERLRSMDCELGQGWLFSKALSQERTEVFLNRTAQLDNPGIDDLHSILNDSDGSEIIP